MTPGPAARCAGVAGGRDGSAACGYPPGAAEGELPLAPAPAESKLLDAFHFGPTLGRSRRRHAVGPEAAQPDVLSCVDAHMAARCMRLCRRARELCTVEHVWEARVRRLCALWGLQSPKLGGWRGHFFNILRPRCDGIYVGECRYLHRIRPGSSMDPKFVNRSYHWVEYRRCIRLLPPSPQDGRLVALVLRDACTFETAAEALAGAEASKFFGLAGGPLAQGPQGQVGGEAPARGGAAALRHTVGVGTYVVQGGRVEINFRQTGAQYFVALQLSHDGDEYFAGRLEWQEYYMTDGQSQAITSFDLGRSVHGGGEPANREKDHYPPLYIRPWRSLEHYL